MQIDPSNLILLEQHLACAAAESPLVLTRDERYFGRKIHKAADTLVLEGDLSVSMSACNTLCSHFQSCFFCCLGVYLRYTLGFLSSVESI